MSAIEITILVIWFLLYIIFRSINAYFGSALVLMTFVFAFIVSNQQFSAFYLLLFLVAIVLDLATPQIKTTSEVASSYNVGKYTLEGFNFITFSLLLGLVIYLGIGLIGKQAGGNIIGAPNLAVTNTDVVAKAFKPTFESALGIVENQIAFVMFDLFLTFGILLPFIGMLVRSMFFIAPMILSGLIMGLFHVTAYSVSVSLMLWASSAFMVFVMIKYLFHDSLSVDFAHYLNNAGVSLSRSLQVVI